MQANAERGSGLEFLGNRAAVLAKLVVGWQAGVNSGGVGESGAVCFAWGDGWLAGMGSGVGLGWSRRTCSISISPASPITFSSGAAGKGSPVISRHQ